MKLTLDAHPPFSLSSVLRSHGWVKLAPFAADEDGSQLSRIERLHSGRVVKLLVEEADGGVTVDLSGGLMQREVHEVEDKVIWMLGLDQDLSAFYDVARGEPKLGQVEARAQGRVLRSPTLFEDVVKTILTTNTSWAGTIRMVESLVSGLATRCPRTARAMLSPHSTSWQDSTCIPSAQLPDSAIGLPTFWTWRAQCHQATWTWSPSKVLMNRASSCATASWRSTGLARTRRLISLSSWGATTSSPSIAGHVSSSPTNGTAESLCEARRSRLLSSAGESGKDSPTGSGTGRT